MKMLEEGKDKERSRKHLGKKTLEGGNEKRKGKIEMKKKKK